MNAALGELKHVGPMITNQAVVELGPEGGTQEGFAAAMRERFLDVAGSRRERSRNLKHSLNRITRNQRPVSCFEGYAIRMHNRLGRDALVKLLRDVGGFPEWILPSTAERSRDPMDAAFDPRLVRNVLGEGPTEGGYAFPHDGGLHPAPWFGEPTYPDGRDPLRTDHPLRDPFLPRAQRDVVVRASPRPQWPCSCFRTRTTCEDMDYRRGNRIGGTARAFCTWLGTDEVDEKGMAVWPACAPDVRPRAMRRHPEEEVELEGEELEAVEGR